MFLDSFDGLCYVYLGSFHSFVSFDSFVSFELGFAVCLDSFHSFNRGFLVVFMIKYVDSVGQIRREFDI